MRTTHKHLNVSTRWLRRKIVEYATYRVFVSRDGGPEVEYERDGGRSTSVRIGQGSTLKTAGMDFFMAMELLYAWMAEANVLITPDGIIHIKAYSTKENK